MRKKALWWLFQTFPPVRARAERVDVKKVAPSAEPGQRFKIKDYLRVTIDKDWLNLPPGAFIGLHSQDKQDDLREEELSLDVSCDFLDLKAVQGLLGGMQPQGLSHQDTEKVLKLLSTLGIVVWIDKAKLRDTVMLNPRQVAVAMANLIALCFGAHNFEHEDDKIEVIKKIEHISESDLLRFRSSGIATQDLIRGVWKKDWNRIVMQREGIQNSETSLGSADRWSDAAEVDSSRVLSSDPSDFVQSTCIDLYQHAEG